MLPDAVLSATYDTANRQLAFGAKSMTFDANGNLTSIADLSGLTTFTWDARNRLSTLGGPSTSASFVYDPSGRRAVKQVNGQSTQYLYDGLDVAQKFDGLGSASYLRSLAPDEGFSFTNRDGTFFSIYDPLGSTLAVTDTGATPVVQYSYDPFGSTSSTNPAFPNPFQFTGRENDGLAGLYFYRARYYSPGLHRFLSRDPLGARGNVYSYARNNPVRFVDAFGLKEIDPSERASKFQRVVVSFVSFNPDDEHLLVAQGPTGLPLEVLHLLWGLSEGAVGASALAIATARGDYTAYMATGQHVYLQWSGVDWKQWDTGTFEGTFQRILREAERARPPL